MVLLSLANEAKFLRRGMMHCRFCLIRAAVLMSIGGLCDHSLRRRICEHVHESDLRCVLLLPWCTTADTSPETFRLKTIPVIYGIHGLRRVGPRLDGGLFSTLALPYWGLIGVGVLSAWFHATLNYHSQMGE